MCVCSCVCVGGGTFGATLEFDRFALFWKLLQVVVSGPVFSVCFTSMICFFDIKDTNNIFYGFFVFVYYAKCLICRNSTEPEGVDTSI